VFVIRVQREIFGPKRVEVRVDWRKLRNEKHVVRMGRREHTGWNMLVKKPKIKGQLARPRVK
jgi:predicted component of viral defense system (DUF524 family)